MVDVAKCDPAALRRIRMTPRRHGVPAIRAAALAHSRGKCRLRAGTCRRAGGASASSAWRSSSSSSALRRGPAKYAHELSGGMQQRVGLARAFATEAPILLMDEPFSALDPLIRTKLQDELLELQRQLKRTIIFVSHDLDEALKIGTRIAIMEAGRIVQYGVAAGDRAQPVERLRARLRRPHEPAQRAARAGGDDIPSPACRAPAANGAVRIDEELTLTAAGRGPARRRGGAGGGAGGRRHGAAPRLHHGLPATRRSAP